MERVYLYQYLSPNLVQAILFQIHFLGKLRVDFLATLSPQLLQIW